MQCRLLDLFCEEWYIWALVNGRWLRLEIGKLYNLKVGLLTGNMRGF